MAASVPDESRKKTENSRGMTHDSSEQATVPDLAPGLYVTATPIGNLGDITLRALDVLRGVDRIACEDTRVSGKLLAHFGIDKPLVAYHEHNEARMCSKLVARLATGERLALVSDAGTPLISDPGYRLVRAAIAQGIEVIAVPGPSAAIAALSVSGLPTDRFYFEGFLPARGGARRERIARLKAIDATLVLYESARRLPRTLSDLAAALDGRGAVVARELTKLFEDVRRDTLQNLARDYGEEGAPKGEVVIIIAPPADDKPDWEEIDAALEAALKEMRLRQAVEEVTARTGAARRAVYQRALAFKKASERGDQ